MSVTSGTISWTGVVTSGEIAFRTTPPPFALSETLGTSGATGYAETLTLAPIALTDTLGTSGVAGYVETLTISAVALTDTAGTSGASGYAETLSITPRAFAETLGTSGATGRAEALTVTLISPAGLWPLFERSGTRTDKSGNALDLTDNGSVGFGEGYANAADFSGSNWLSVGSNSDLQTGDVSFSVCAWVYMDSTSGIGMIVGKAVGGYSNGEWQLINKHGKFEFSVIKSSPNTQKDATWTNAAVAGKWYFVVGSYDATADTVNISVDDASYVSTSHSGGANVGTSPLYFGTYDSTIWFLNGRVEGVGFWKRTLTADERTWLFNKGCGRRKSEIDAHATITNNLISYWTLSNPSNLGEDAHGTNDLTNNGNVGVAQGNVWGKVLARKYDGSNDYHSIASNADLQIGNNDAIFEFWLNPDDITDRYVISKRGATNEFSVYTYFDTGKLTAAFWNTVGGTTNAAVTCAANTWQHCFVWHDAANNQVGMSIDGTVVTTAMDAGGVQVSTNDLNIGRRNGGDLYFLGGIGRLRYWKGSGARTLIDNAGSERETLNNNGRGYLYADLPAGIPAPTRAWDLDEHSGAAIEATGSGDDLTDNGGVGSEAGPGSLWAADFDGVDDKLSRALSTELQLDNRDCTIIVPFLLDDKSSSRNLAAVYKNETGGRSWYAQYNATSDRFIFNVSHNLSAITSVTANTHGSPAVGRWGLLFLSSEHGVRIGIAVNDGAYDYTTFTSGVAAATSANFTIGNTTDGFGWYDGRMRLPVKIDRLLTPQEREWIWNNGQFRTYQEILGYTG